MQYQIINKSGSKKRELRLQKELQDFVLKLDLLKKD